MRIKVLSPLRGSICRVLAVNDRYIENYSLKPSSENDRILEFDYKDTGNYTLIGEKELSRATLVRGYSVQIFYWYESQKFSIVHYTREYEVKGHIHSTESLYNGERYTFLTIVQ